MGRKPRRFLEADGEIAAFKTCRRRKVGNAYRLVVVSFHISDCLCDGVCAPLRICRAEKYAEKGEEVTAPSEIGAAIRLILHIRNGKHLTRQKVEKLSRGIWRKRGYACLTECFTDCISRRRNPDTTAGNGSRRVDDGITRQKDIAIAGLHGKFAPVYDDGALSRGITFKDIDIARYGPPHDIRCKVAVKPAMADESIAALIFHIKTTQQIEDFIKQICIVVMQV